MPVIWKAQTKDKPLRESKSVYDKRILLVRMRGILRMSFLPCGKKHEPKSKKHCHTAENDQRAPRIMVKRISAYGLCYSPDSKATEDPANEDFWSWRIGTRDFSGFGMIRRGVSHYLKNWVLYDESALDEVTAKKVFSRTRFYSRIVYRSAGKRLWQTVTQ